MVGRAIIAILLFASPSLALAEKAEMAERVGRSFFEAILAGNTQVALRLSGRRVNFDGHLTQNIDEIKAQYRKMSERAVALGLRLKSVQTLDKNQMLKKYGPPPKRIRGETSNQNAQFVLARFNRKGAVAILAKQGIFWRVVAITD